MSDQRQKGKQLVFVYNKLCKMRDLRFNINQNHTFEIGSALLRFMGKNRRHEWLLN